MLPSEPLSPDTRTVPVVLVGPTASGKSQIGLELARRDRTFEVLSVDSMQVYRGMDIGTAKPTAAEQAEVRHHLIDLIEPHELMDIVDFAAAYSRARIDIASRQGRSLLVGGTGLYVRAVIDELAPPPRHPDIVAELETEPDTVALHTRLAALDPLAASRMEPNNRRRVLRALEVCLGTGQPFSSFGPGLEQYPNRHAIQVGIDVDRGRLDRRIHDRYDQQMQRGFLAEVESLLDAAQPMSQSAGQALGYKELAMFLAGEFSLDGALDLARQRTRRFARRQQRWFRRDPRITWFVHNGDPAHIVDAVADHIATMTDQLANK